MRDLQINVEAERLNLGKFLQTLPEGVAALLDQEDPEWRAMLSPVATGPSLTQRDCKLLWLLCQGLSNKEIACILERAEATIKNNLGFLFEKIGVSDRTNAVIWAHRHGVILGDPHENREAPSQGHES